MADAYGIEIKSSKYEVEVDQNFLEEINWALDDAARKGESLNYSMIDMSGGSTGTHLVLCTNTPEKPCNQKPTPINIWPRERIQANARSQALFGSEFSGSVSNPFHGLGQLMMHARFN
ncbi:MAG TPA: hypothetical protein VFN51_01835 [Candidatus Saccharimonadales bacterium]|nr:hypothetical protein [Candidatus Saccharimonadales bacterium]